MRSVRAVIGLSRQRQQRDPRVTRVFVVLALVLLFEALTRWGAIRPLTMPPPTEIVEELVRQVTTSTFAADLSRSLYTIAVAFGVGLVGGLLLGMLFWRVPFLGAVFDPYLATMYAMPTLVFYPILVAILGLGAAPIITIASIMAMVPIALNTMVALRSVNPVLPKLARSLNCSKGQRYRKVIIPAATPLAIPGVKLGFIYSVIGTIAMEFVLASHGIGFRIGFNYRAFEIVAMFAYILVVALLSITVNSLLNLLERRVRRDMT